MVYAYRYCYNLTGAVIGDKVTNAYQAYANCSKVKGNVYINTNNITNIINCFGGRSHANRLNIYIPANTSSSTFNCIIGNTSDGTTIVNNAISWTQSGSYYYNTVFNIYVYPTL